MVHIQFRVALVGLFSACCLAILTSAQDYDEPMPRAYSTQAPTPSAYHEPSSQTIPFGTTSELEAAPSYGDPPMSSETTDADSTLVSESIVPSVIPTSSRTPSSMTFNTSPSSFWTTTGSPASDTIHPNSTSEAASVSNDDSATVSGTSAPDNPGSLTSSGSTSGPAVQPSVTSSDTAETGEATSASSDASSSVSSNVATTFTNDNGQTIVSSSAGLSTPGSSTSNKTHASTVSQSSALDSTTNGQTTLSTVTEASTTAVNSAGQTVFSSTDGNVTLPSEISQPTTITSGNRTITFVPPGASSSTTVDAGGSASSSSFNGSATVPTGVPSSGTTSEPSGTTKASNTSPDASPNTTSARFTNVTAADTSTIISNTGGIFTLPTGLTESTVLTSSNGAQVTFVPSETGSSTIPTSGTSADASTVTSNTVGTFTLPTGLTNSTVLTNSDGAELTFVPSETGSPNATSPSNPAENTTLTSTESFSTDTNGLTIISTTDGVVTLPTGVTTPTVLTLPGGQSTTFTPPSPSSTIQPSGSTSFVLGTLVPVTTSVDEPKATDGGSVIPCDLWFFSSCISFWGIDILGWMIDLPPGPRPPGPVPSIDPPPGIQFRTIGPLPSWPRYTIGPDRIPTFPARPTGPDGGCETETAELCATTTSFDVSLSQTATVTTSSAVLSTCVTVAGCNVEDSATTSSTTSSTSCSVSADLSIETGLCENGNYPLYDPESDSIDCDASDEDVVQYMSGCQEDADDFPEYSTDEIECLITCPANGSEDKLRRDIELPAFDPYENGLPAESLNLTKRQQGGRPPKRPRVCPSTPPASYPGQVHPGRQGECDVVFKCDSDLWPNVCNNAKSAQVERAKPTALTYQGTGARQDYVTSQWWRTHFTGGDGANTQENSKKTNANRTAGILKNQPHGGWGLVGCEVEEYPFGNSLKPLAESERWKWSNRATLRLVPWEENQAHGNALGQFIKKAQKGEPGRSLPALTPPFTYCVDITGGNIDTAEWLLGEDQSKNRCGQAYGPGFLLVNDISVREARAAVKNGRANERVWDEWFDRNNQLFDHTVYSSGSAIHTKALPSQFGARPAPGMKTFIRSGNDPNSGTWSNVAPNGVTVGTSDVRGPPGATGQNLKYDSPNDTHPGILKRNVDIHDLGYDPRPMTTPPVTPAPSWKSNSPAQMHSTSSTAQVPLQARRPIEQVRAKKATVITAAASKGVSDKSPLLTRAQKLNLKRQSANSGSFLDSKVYRQAFLCAAPENDPCEVDDCWEGGVVYDADGNIAGEGSADQSGDDGGSTSMSPSSNTTVPSSNTTIASSTTTTSSSNTTMPSLGTTISSSNMTIPSLTTTTQSQSTTSPLRTIETASGSSCAFTGPIVTRCGGAGGRDDCSIVPACESWIATTTEAPSTTSTPSTTDAPTTAPEETSSSVSPPPLSISPVVCHDEDDYPGHADVASHDQWGFCNEFCGDLPYMYPGDAPLGGEFQDYHGVNYDYRVEWIEGCELPEGSDFVDPMLPLDEYDFELECPWIMNSCYTGCNNGGVGGYIDAGCLRYTFTGAI